MGGEKTGTGGTSGRVFEAGPGGLSAEDFTRWYRDHELEMLKALDVKAVAEIAAAISKARDENRQVFIMGNGGSACISSMISTDLAKTACVEGKPLLRCISLTDNLPFLTAIGNDIGYEAVFVRQMENLLNKGDIAVIISGSGNSPNVLEAAKFAKARGAVVVALTGFDGGKLKPMADISLHVKSNQYGVIEDVHQAVGHVLAFYIRQADSV